MVAVEARGQYDGAGGVHDPPSRTFLKVDLRAERDSRSIRTTNERCDSEGQVVLRQAFIDRPDSHLQLASIEVDRLILAGFMLPIDERTEWRIGMSIGVQFDRTPLYRRPLTQRHGEEVRGAMISAVTRRRNPTRCRREGLRGMSCVSSVNRIVRKEESSAR